MASKTSIEGDMPVIDMAEFGARIAARRAELGMTNDTAQPKLVKGRNAGHRRTPSKRALLKAIEDAGGKW